MEEHLVRYLLIINKKECYTYFLVVVVKQSALVWLDLVLTAIVTKDRNSEATFGWLSKQCNYPAVRMGSGNNRVFFLVLLFVLFGGGGGGEAVT